LPVYSPQNPSTTYRQQSVLTATPGKLVVMLYDGCLRFLHQAAHALRAGDARECDGRLRRAEAIIDELLSTLDKDRGGVVASRLEGIYVFSKRHLIEARIERDPAMIDKVGELLGELRGAWAEIAGS
jgi:flagellar secretion chaperone FliS